MLPSQLKSSISVWKVGMVFEIFAAFIQYGEQWLKLMDFLRQSFAETTETSTAMLFTIVARLWWEKGLKVWPEIINL